MRSRNQMIVVPSRRPPTVEIDTAAGAAYVRFKREETPIARSRQLDRLGYPRVTIEYDKGGELVGVQLLGVVEFSVIKLLEMAQLRMPNADLSRARYVGVGYLETPNGRNCAGNRILVVE